MKQFKENKGITLIALVVTVIVLIILAGVSINMLVGENGIINMAQRAKNETEQAKKEEEQALASAFERNYVTYNGQLHVEGKKLVNQYGEIVQLKGVNLGGRDYLYLYNYTIIENLKKAGINCIRIGLGTEYYTNQEYMQYMKNIIDDCIGLDLYVDLIFWNNGNPNENLLSAQQYFDYWGSNYKDSVNIIYEICNEVDEATTWNDIKEYSNTIISQIRSINEKSITREKERF